MQSVNKPKKSNKIRAKKLFVFITVICLIVTACAGLAYVTSAADTSDVVNNLQNGSFEEGQTFTGSYFQPDQSKVPYWNTTAFQGKLELFKENVGIYVKNGDVKVRLKPTDGTYAAELNADEESTLYQIVKTSPSSVYEWGLDHGARNGVDTMALIIGPSQTNKPSKPNKDGRDQFMQMTDWLTEKGIISDKDTAGMGEQVTVYSKKFGTKGTFEDNADNNAFSLTPSTIYTERWEIWIMSSQKAGAGVTVNPWNSYGSNAKEEADSNDTSLDLDKYYNYSVPAGQTDTIFGFVSVGYKDTIAPAGKEKTFGNFIDNISFKLYHPISAGTTNHGTVIIGGSDGSTGGEGASEGYEVTIDNKYSAYVTDGETLRIQAVIKKADMDDGCMFVGVNYTQMGEDGNPVTVFLKVSDDNTIEDSGSLTEEEKIGKWVKSTNSDGDVIYTYYMTNLKSATDLHFIFIKNPTVTYDPNGGMAYVIEDRPHDDEAENVYSFKPKDYDNTITDNSFIPPYTSKEPEGQNDGWKFMGWLITGDEVDSSDISDSSMDLINFDKLNSLILPAVHTIACDYSIDGAVNNEKAAQYFTIYDGGVTLSKNVTHTEDTSEITGVKWVDDNKATKLYANVHCGVTMIAQWRWRQAFIPQIVKNGVISASGEGGTVEITSVDAADENYNDAYTASGGKAYHAATDETVTVKAKANAGWIFKGWYNEDGKLVSTNAEYGYIESKESVNTYYARFTNSITQTYIRQINNGGTWVDTTNDSIGTLDRYTYTDAPGSLASSTAEAKNGYYFVGWYDNYGVAVPDERLTNNGATISYITEDDATYYARFVKRYNLVVSKIDGDRSTDEQKTPLAGAEFTLYQKDDSGNVDIQYGGSTIKCSVVAVETTAMNSGRTQATASFGYDLIPGMEYYLIETKAPDAYFRDENVYNIVISDTETVVQINGVAKEISGSNVNIEITNYLKLIMPVAGSTVTGMWYIAAGLILLFAAAAGLRKILL